MRGDPETNPHIVVRGDHSKHVNGPYIPLVVFAHLQAMVYFCFCAGPLPSPQPPAPLVVVRHLEMSLVVVLLETSLVLP